MTTLPVIDHSWTYMTKLNALENGRVTTPRLWSIEDAAEYLQVSITTVRRMLRSGKISAQKVGAQWRFDPTELQRHHRPKPLTVSVSVDPGRSATRSAPLAHVPQWATPIISRWRRFIEGQLELHSPDHVIVSDRRGSKIWELFGLEAYRWGENLWHSGGAKAMSLAERRRLFSRRKVLLFDEILQRGRELSHLRRLIEDAEATVVTAVCVRRRSLADRGEVIVEGVAVAEDLTDDAFAERAASVSRLTSTFRPPLDVDHLVVRGTLHDGLTIAELLPRLARWGLPFVIWHPTDIEDASEEWADGPIETLAITLDRPQFFDTAAFRPEGVDIRWDGPCKVRFYINFANRTCDCSFIIYPTIRAQSQSWLKLAHQRTEELGFSKRIGEDKLDEALLRRIYTSICMELTRQLLRDFVHSGAAQSIGIDLSKAAQLLDAGQFRATFGPALGNRILRRATETLQSSQQLAMPLQPTVGEPLAEFLRTGVNEAELSHSTFDCRSELLPLVPKQFRSDPLDVQHPRCLPYFELLNKLPNYSQATIGTVIDYEIDRGTSKPYIDVLSDLSNGHLTVLRGFVRGEFGPYYEWQGDEPTYDDAQLQFALCLGPTVLELFTRAIGRPSLTSIEFAKVFANLEHDWKPRFGCLLLGWKAYKFGPIPIVPIPAPSGEFTRYESFLVQQRCVTETPERHGSQTWNRYSVPTESPVPWRELYRSRTDAATRAFVIELVKAYAAILKLSTHRSSAPRSDAVRVFHDSLVVLAAARNKKIAYSSSWFEVHDWLNKGRLLFPLIKAETLRDTPAPGPVLEPHLAAYAQPARLLHEKLEMYRCLPQLRCQLEKLQDEHPHVAVILESVDDQPMFETVSPYPLANLEWAAKVMRSFTSLVRQIMTASGLDTDKRSALARTDPTGTPIDGPYFLRELVTACPELGSFQAALTLCISDSVSGHLDERIAVILAKTFALIQQLFSRPGFLPDPRPEFESRREHGSRMDGLVKRLKEIAVAEPFAVGVADVRNLANLPSIGDIFGTTRDDALSGVLAWLARAGKAVEIQFPTVRISGVCADNLILAGPPEDVILAARLLIQETTRKLVSIDHSQLSRFGLLRVGVALVERSRGEHFAAADPGIEAHKIGDRSGRPLGTIAITNPVFDALTPSSQNEFVLGDEPETKQGVVWVRSWSHERDGR